MNKKMIFFDIDGTLLDEEKHLPASTKQAIADLRGKGHEVAIATGRAPFMFEDIRKELNIDSYVSLNGQVVVHQGELIYGNPIRPDLLQSFMEYATGNDHPLIYSDRTDMKVNMDKHILVETSLAPLKTAMPSYDPSYYMNRIIYQMMVFCTEEYEETYRSEFPELKFVRWHPVSMDVMPANGSKANGIQKMIEKLGIDRQNVYAFGDGLNDLEMMEFVGHGVAMGNGPDAVKAAAKYVTKHVDDDGILYGLQLVGLL
ncbi:Cof-type HAD-IIB family hydrolase [Paenibacillus albiflavus]|uniref:Cof-type HAD-IIB family hydrolase n=1 Tax=Paenibacillus albiflavus TaxID=2545760 RepID=A0A4V2WN97_9BACL|nr:Cof-type HAD-IIB family hydrolase [Paenibacillus albiflavus]TCZ74692.1 Cof-type HAD-IIB family hydrolase [Paenibacillus albiflavus]